MRRLTIVTIAAVASLAGPAAAAVLNPGKLDRREAIEQLLTGAELRIIDGQDGRERSRGTITHAAVGRCNLFLRTDSRTAGSIGVPLRHLRFVQGDGEAMLDIAVGADPRLELILAVGSRRYAAAMDRLSSLARNCGAVLVEPPPLVRTPQQ